MFGVCRAAFLDVGFGQDPIHILRYIVFRYDSGPTSHCPVNCECLIAHYMFNRVARAIPDCSCTNAPALGDNSSGIPPVLVEITGIPNDMASTKTVGSPSCSPSGVVMEGKTSRSTLLSRYNPNNSSLGIAARNSTKPWRPRSSIDLWISPCRGPSPNSVPWKLVSPSRNELNAGVQQIAMTFYRYQIRRSH